MDREPDQSLSSIRGLQELPSNGLTRRRFLMTAGGSIGYLLLASCAQTAETTTTTAAPATTAAPVATAPALSEVVFGLSGDPDTLDPHTTIAGNAWIALCNIFDGLTMLDYSSLEAPVPLIAVWRSRGTSRRTGRRTPSTSGRMSLSTTGHPGTARLPCSISGGGSMRDSNITSRPLMQRLQGLSAAWRATTR